VRLKHAGGHSSIFYRNDPMRVVGGTSRHFRSSIERTILEARP